MRQVHHPRGGKLLTGPSDPHRLGVQARDFDESPGRGRHVCSGNRGILSITWWTTIGTLIPGMGLLVGGRRRVGLFFLGLALLFPVLLVIGFSSGTLVPALLQVVVSPEALLGLALFICIAAGVWMWMTWATLSSLGGRKVARPHIWLAGALVTGLFAAVGLPAAAVTSATLQHRSLLQTIFGSNVATGPAPVSNSDRPWANIPSINVLLLGSDAGDGRTGIRPDTIMVANIDTQTGKTLLVSLPRNLEKAKFPAGSKAAKVWPKGFATGEKFPYINGAWRWAESNPQYFPNSENPGLTATSMLVQEATGLTINYWAVVNLQGFVDIVDAMGGLEIKVNKRVAKDRWDAKNPKEWIEPGQQTLNGEDALWYGRSRWQATDYDRMARQRCVIGAISRQADPIKLAGTFPKLVASAKRNISTNIPLNHLPAFVTLAQRVRGAQVNSLAFTRERIKPENPDYDLIRSLVSDAIAANEAPAGVSPSPTSDTPATGQVSPTTGTSSAPSGTATPESKTSADPTAPASPSSVDEVCS